MEWYSIIAAIIIVWLILNVLDQLGYLSRFDLSVESGFFLAWRTERGKKFIDKLVNRFETFFSKLGTINIFSSIAAILVVTAILVFQLIFTFEKTEMVSQLQIEQAIILPGFAIPILYGSIALGVAIVFHEFSHGIYARLENIKISSLGIGIFAILPLAFVEPDEEDIKKSSRLSRIKMFAAGVSTNIYIAIIAFLIVALLITISFNPVCSGLGVTIIDHSSPAWESGLREDMVITKINDIEVDDRTDFLNIITKSKPGDTLLIQTKYHGNFNPELIEKDGEAYLGIGGVAIKGLYDTFRSPIAYISPQLGQSLTVLDSPFYESNIDPMISLNLIQAGFWIVLVNFWLGIINMMPIYPLDGGRVFKEPVNSLVERIDSITNKEKASRYIVTLISVTFLVIYISPILVLLIL